MFSSLVILPSPLHVAGQSQASGSKVKTWISVEIIYSFTKTNNKKHSTFLKKPVTFLLIKGGINSKQCGKKDITN